MPAIFVTLDRNGETPAVEITVGNEMPSRYDVHLFDATGANPQLIGTGQNGNPKTFPLPGPPVSALDQTTIMWRAVINSATGQPGDNNFVVTVRVIQNGNVKGSDSKTGFVTDIPPEGFFRLQVS
jgi:molybdopterin biosynthesis enzyme